MRTSVRILERSQNNGFATLKNELEVRLKILSIYENRSLLAAPLDLRLTHLDRSVTITCLFICAPLMSLVKDIVIKTRSSSSTKIRISASQAASYINMGGVVTLTNLPYGEANKGP